MTKAWEKRRQQKGPLSRVIKSSKVEEKGTRNEYSRLSSKNRTPINERPESEIPKMPPGTIFARSSSGSEILTLNKEGYPEKAEVEKGRVLVRRLLTLEEEMEMNKRQDHRPIGVGSVGPKEQYDRRERYIRLVPRLEGESRKTWMAKERKAFREEREAVRMRDPNNSDPNRMFKMMQIARAPGQPIENVFVAEPEFVPGISHRGRFRR